MISKTFNREQYLNYEDLNEIENNIYEVTEEFKQITSIPTFNKKIWVLNEFPWIEEIDRIEQGIENLGKYFYKPYGWIETRTWINEARKAIFDYNDINRWINNINLIYEHKNDMLSIWNGVSYINWNETSEFEWEE